MRPRLTPAKKTKMGPKPIPPKTRTTLGPIPVKTKIHANQYNTETCTRLAPIRTKMNTNPDQERIDTHTNRVHSNRDPSQPRQDKTEIKTRSGPIPAESKARQKHLPDNTEK